MATLDFFTRARRARASRHLASSLLGLVLALGGPSSTWAELEAALPCPTPACSGLSSLGNIRLEIGPIRIVNQDAQTVGSDGAANRVAGPVPVPMPSAEAQAFIPDRSLNATKATESVHEATSVAAEALRVASAKAVTADLPSPPGATPSQAAFIVSAAKAARVSQLKTGVPASVTIAQAILESDWGLSRLAHENKNYFGIKSHGIEGSAGVVWYLTWEVVDGEDIEVEAPFRAYATMADSFVDHGRFFHVNPRYAAALAVTDDPRAFAQAINEAGYATDPDYAAKLIRLMDRFNLYAYNIR